MKFKHEERELYKLVTMSVCKCPLIIFIYSVSGSRVFPMVRSLEKKNVYRCRTPSILKVTTRLGSHWLMFCFWRVISCFLLHDTLCTAANAAVRIPCDKCIVIASLAHLFLHHWRKADVVAFIYREHHGNIDVTLISFNVNTVSQQIIAKT